MPTYQYECAKCGETFEQWQSIKDDALKKHPGCGGKVTKVLGSVGIVLKGSGFYKNDSRSSSRSTSTKVDKSDTTATAGSSGSSDSSSGSSESSGSSGSSAGTKSEPASKSA